MFTGIVQTLGRIADAKRHDFGVRLSVDPRGWDYQPTTGDSIAVNGVCLTHAPQSDDPPGMLGFDVIRETLAWTNLGDLAVGDGVNLEASVRPDTAMAGHFVQGHIDARGTVAAIQSDASEWRMTVRVQRDLLPLIVPKGSIAIDGVSLTIASVDTSAATFTVALIPTTLDLTNLGAKQVGDTLNLETDILARTVVHYLQLREQAEQGESSS